MAKKKMQWARSFGDFAEIYNNGPESVFALKLIVGNGFPGNPVTQIVAINTLRLSTIKEAIVKASTLFEKEELSQEELETVLDYLFAELNRRLNK